MSQYESQFEENLYQLRRDKLAQIAALVRAQNPALSDIEAKYPNTFAFTHTIPELRAIGDPLDTETLAANKIEAAISGRIMAIRVQGKAGFAQLQQGGQRLQLYVRKDDAGETIFDLYKLLDLGDHIGVRGYLMRTRTGELTLHASSITLPGHIGQPAITFLSKAMLALPDKYHGLEDVELRYRQRYVDLIMNSGTRAETSPGNTASAPTPNTPANLSSRPEPAALAALPEGAGGFSPLNAAPTEGASAPGLSPALPTTLSSRPESAPSADAAERPATPPAPTTPPTPSTTEPLNIRATFVKRAAILRAIRKFFDTRGYLEVETPMLHTIAGGAAARTFSTHHNAEDMELTLRIAPELHLKRLVVGGLDRVYEINRNFRNEGIDRTHNPEFTMLEFYQAYANYNDLMDLTQELITVVAMEVNGTTITSYNGAEIDLSKWRKLSMRNAIIEWWEPEWGPSPTNSDFATSNSMLDWLARVHPVAAKRQIEVSLDLEDTKRLGVLLILIPFWMQQTRPGSPLGKSFADLFEFVAEPHLIQPTIICDFPLAVSPLSKVKPNEPDWVERFEFYIGGMEVGNAFSELNDPDDQRNRFLDQLQEKARGDAEAMAMDEDYVRALGYGLPPTAGEGIGIDRLTMILTGARSIRDVILFPLMRPHKPTDPEPGQPHGESAE